MANLVDSLVPTVDALRASLYPQMGTREYEVHVVRRTWSGGRVGEGTASVVSDTILTPPPKYAVPGAQALDWQAMPGGRDESGNAVLSEISLTYTENDLSPMSLGDADELYYRIVDPGGEGIRTRYYVVAAPPFPDREQDIGWVVQLKIAKVDEP